MKLTRLAAASVALAAFAGPAFGQQPDDVAAIRRDMDALRKDYEARIAELEARLAKAEGSNTTTPADAPPAPPDATAPDTTTTADTAAPADQLVAVPPPADVQPASAPVGANGNIYNPGISVALNGFYTAAKKEPSEARIAGFAPGDDILRPKRGFSIGESEVSFAANIDPFLAGFFDFSIDNEDKVAVEEAYIRTTALPAGLTVKAGRFLSGIAYTNERHAHDWNFSDAALPYRAFLNNQFGDDGVQVRWIAPTDQFLEFGAEAFRGEAFPAAGSANRGVGAYSAFVTTGNDLGLSSSYLAKLSYLHTKALDRASGPDLFSGNSDLGVATLVYKWAPGGNPIVRNLNLVGEYFWGKDDGSFNGVPVDQSHTGWYLQGVYQFQPRWSAGLRVAGLSSDAPGPALLGSALDDMGHSPMEYTGLLEFDTSEFGRLRLQYARDESERDVKNDVLTLQYTIIYGPHGAHRY